MPRRFPVRLASLAAALALSLALPAAAVQAQAIPRTDTAPKATKSAKINVNTATTDELQELSGVGPATAEKIVAGRPYTSIDDLGRAGLSERLIESIRSKVTVGRASSSTARKAETTAEETKATTTPKAKKTSKPADEAKTTTRAKTPTTSTTTPAGPPVNLNTADAEALQTLPRIGPATARAIIAGRPYRSVDELAKVNGLSPARIEVLRPLVTLGAAASTTTASTPRSTTASEPKAKAAPAEGGPVNVNTADAEALQTLPGVGPALAEAIIAGRPYKSIDDLAEVKGLGDAKLAALKGRVSFGRPAPAPTAAPATTVTRTSEPRPAAPTGPVDVNTADAETLQTLPGVGPAIAEAIIAGRPYKGLDDLQNVKGLGEAKVAALKDQVRFGRFAAPATDDLTVVVNVNTADAETLQTLPGVGPAIAQSIIAARPIRNLEQLQEVKGVGEAKAAALKGRVGFSLPASTTTTARTTEPKPAPAGGSDDLTVVVNVNTADAGTLQTLPGVGPAIAEGIIAGRPFKNLEELQQVKGLGEAKVAALQDRISFGPAARAPKTETASRPAPNRTPVEVEDDLGPIRAEFGQKINLNTATADELETLLGIGPVRAQAIIAGRPYQAIEDVMTVKGIKEKTFAKIKDYIRVK